MDTLDEVLEHFGIKGMHWGVRRSRDSGGDSASRGKSVSVDAARFQKASKKVKTRGISSLSNAELKALNERMNLEQNYGKLTGTKSNVEKAKKGHEAIKQIIGVGMTAKQTYDLVNSPMARDIGKLFAKKQLGGE